MRADGGTRHGMAWHTEALHCKEIKKEIEFMSRTKRRINSVEEHAECI